MSYTKLAVLLMLLVLAACSTSAPLVNLDQRPISAPAGTSIKTIHDALARGIISAGWRISDDQAGQLQASVDVREHSVTVNIPYSASSYDIHYQSSRNMELKGQEIHRNYNRWVSRLDSYIQKELQLLSYPEGQPTG